MPLVSFDYIKDGQSIQWPRDTKDIARSRISKKESIQLPKDNKGITRSRISKKDCQYNDQKIPKA
jgi:hypothetical protein